MEGFSDDCFDGFFGHLTLGHIQPFSKLSNSASFRISDLVLTFKLHKFVHVIMNSIPKRVMASSQAVHILEQLPSITFIKEFEF